MNYVQTPHIPRTLRFLQSVACSQLRITGIHHSIICHTYRFSHWLLAEAETPGPSSPHRYLELRFISRSNLRTPTAVGQHQEEAHEWQTPSRQSSSPPSKHRICNCCPTKELGNCPYGTYDPAGWDSDDTHGHEWDNTIWISSQAVRTGKVPDVVLHEVGHAVVHNLFDDCYFPKQAETTVKELLLQTFTHGEADPAELLADAFVVAFNTHSGELHTHYFEQFN